MNEEFRHWLHRPKPNPSADAQMLCFSHAGGSAAFFAKWAEELPALEVCGVELPGHFSRLREPLSRRMHQIIDAIGPLLVNHLIDRTRSPILCGYSLGAVVAFELTRYLEANGETPRHLVVFARKAPHLPWSGRNLYSLPERQLVEEIGKRYGGIPKEILREKEVLQMLLPVLRADLEILGHYRCEVENGVSCPITAFGGADDAENPPEDVARWAELTTASFTHHTLEGGHFFVDSNRDAVFSRLRAAIASSRPDDIL